MYIDPTIPLNLISYRSVGELSIVFLNSMYCILLYLYCLLLLVMYLDLVFLGSEPFVLKL